MPYNQISINLTSQWGMQVKSYRNSLIQTKNFGKELLGKATSMVSGSDYSQLEAQFGLPTGKGAAFYGELNSVVGKLESNTSQTNVAAAIEQFCNFIG